MEEGNTTTIILVGSATRGVQGVEARMNREAHVSTTEPGAEVAQVPMQGWASSPVGQGVLSVYT